MKPHQIERQIDDRLSPHGLVHWNGMVRELRNEAIVIAQRDGLDAAVEHIEALASDADNAED